jgi:recombinational DNA repair protein RecR
MDDEIMFAFHQPLGPRVSDKVNRERLIRAERFRNRKENIDTCMECDHMSRRADCKACLICIQNNISNRS